MFLRGHTKTYSINQLVYFEPHDCWEAAWRKEQQIKRHPRAWKFNLIEDGNPGWKDLWFDITDQCHYPFPPALCRGLQTSSSLPRGRSRNSLRSSGKKEMFNAKGPH